MAGGDGVHVAVVCRKVDVIGVGAVDLPHAGGVADQHPRRAAGDGFQRRDAEPLVEGGEHKRPAVCHQRLGLAVRDIAQAEHVGRGLHPLFARRRGQVAAAGNGKHGVRLAAGRLQYPGEVFVFEQVGHGKVILAPPQLRPFGKHALVRRHPLHMLPGVGHHRDPVGADAVIFLQLAAGKLRYRDDLFAGAGNGPVLQPVPCGAEPRAGRGVKVRPGAVTDIVNHRDAAEAKQRDDVAGAQPQPAVLAQVGRVVQLLPQHTGMAAGLHCPDVPVRRRGGAGRHGKLHLPGGDAFIQLSQQFQRVPLDAGYPLGQKCAVHCVHIGLSFLQRPAMAGAAAGLLLLVCALRETGAGGTGPRLWRYSRPPRQIRPRFSFSASTRAALSSMRLSGMVPSSTAATTASKASARPFGISKMSAPACTASTAASPAE